MFQSSRLWIITSIIEYYNQLLISFFFECKIIDGKLIIEQIYSEDLRLKKNQYISGKGIYYLVYT